MSDGFNYHTFQPENTSHYPTIDSGITLYSGAGTFTHQAQSLSNKGWADLWLPHATVCAHVPQVFSACCHTSMWSTSMQSTDEERVTPRPGYLTLRGVGLPVTRRRSDSLRRMTFSCFNFSTPASHAPLNLTLPESGSFALGPVITNGESVYSGEHTYTNTNRREDELSTNVPPYKGYHSDSSIAYSPLFRPRPSGSDYSRPLPTTMLQGQISPACVVTISPDFPTPLTLQGIPCNSPKTQYEDQRVSRDIPRQFPQMSKDPAPTSLSRGPASSGRSPSAREALERSYSCEKCDKEFTQPQGLNRHRREIHEPKTCTFCGAFKWGRRYLLKEHLKKKHPELNTDSALAHHGATRGSKCSTRRQVPLSAVEHHRNVKMGALRPLLRVGVA
ncbi:hypothetical protein BJV78DRAFT_754161 [Lactifluus subvellereus]|nr:hypothetical protein BJV78DRAFT_754161 [Lactifluus subvellereus]